MIGGSWWSRLHDRHKNASFTTERFEISFLVTAIIRGYMISRNGRVRDKTKPYESLKRFNLPKFHCKHGVDVMLKWVLGKSKQEEPETDWE